MRWIEESSVQTPADAERILGVKLNTPNHALRQAYDKAVSEQSAPLSDIRLAYKLADDLYYRATFEHYGSLASVARAGFFEDGLTPGKLLGLMNPNWLVTPLDKLVNQIDLMKHKPPHDRPRVVLLTTGCFAPVHEGHISMMRAAWARLAEDGYAVIGGFFSSSHDSYVSTKGSDAASFNGLIRQRSLNKALASHDWLISDPWEALHVPGSINFTSVIRRLKLYINRHITSHPPIEVAYIYGSDNAGFSRAFIKDGLAVCVSRPGHEEKCDEIKSDPMISGNQRVLFTDPSKASQSTPKLSSTAIRLGQQPSMAEIIDELPAVGDAVEGPRLPPVTGATSLYDRATYLIRDDVRWSAAIWEHLTDRQQLSSACRDFTRSLGNAFVEAFMHANTPGYPRYIKPIYMGLADQTIASLDLVQDHKVINNDVATMQNGIPGGLSRLFSLSGPQFHPGALIERPENIGSLARLAQTPPGRYILVDDDIATGTTMKALRAALPAGCTVDREVALSEKAFKKQFPKETYEFWDVVDGRDFLMGSKAGGLVVRLFNERIARAPYIAPYTTLSSRANIPPPMERSLSMAILRLNAKFFDQIGNTVTLRDTSEPFQNLMAAAGFAPDDLMTSICQWHLDNLLA